MTKLFIIVILLFLKTSFASGQVVEERVEKFLKASNIDSSIIYTYPCSGYIAIDSCSWDPKHYLIWKRQGEYFIKRFDYCQNFRPILIDTINPLKFYFTYKKTIDKEDIKQPTYIEIRKTRKRLDTLLVTTTVSHSCYHKFVFNTKTKSKTKQADSYDLTFAKFDNGKRNIYYSVNQRTKLKALIDEFSKLVELLDTAQKFVAE